jgi:hypothetical protein
MFSRKVQAAISAALLFFVISSPFTYRLVDNLLTPIFQTVLGSYWASAMKIADAGCPTTYGLAVHATVFGVVAYLMMRNA